jgi:ABC-type dipeptide/oligopeptide/nickel transport system permease component
MFAFTLRRAVQAIGVMIAVGIIAFSMFRFAGDPVNQIVSIDTPAAEREAVRKSLGLDDPVPCSSRGTSSMPRSSSSASPINSASRLRTS